MKKLYSDSTLTRVNEFLAKEENPDIQSHIATTMLVALKETAEIAAGDVIMIPVSFDKDLNQRFDEMTKAVKIIGENLDTAGPEELATVIDFRDIIVFMTSIDLARDLIHQISEVEELAATYREIAIDLADGDEEEVEERLAMKSVMNFAGANSVEA